MATGTPSTRHARRGCVGNMPRRPPGRRFVWRRARRTCSGRGGVAASPGSASANYTPCWPSTRPGVREPQGVLAIARAARTVDVLAMTTYERLLDATLAYGLMPLVVPQLKT